MTFSNNKRLRFIDNAKALGIFLVILAHTEISTPLQNWIYTFHMPLFFFISGYLFSFNGKKDLTSFIKKRYKQLIIPYIQINIITYLFWFLILRHVGTTPDETVAAWKPLAAALIVDGENMIHDVPLWFLACLFFMEVIYFLIFINRKITTRLILITTFALLGYFAYITFGNSLPFSFGTMLTAMVFYAIGNEMRRRNFQFTCDIPSISPKARLFTNIIVIAILAIATTYISAQNGMTRMHRNMYGNYLYFLIGGTCGTFMTITFCKLFEKNIPIITFISNNTLWICGFHFLTFALIKGFLLYIVKFDLSKLNDAIAYNILFAIASLTICTIGIYITKITYNHIKKNKARK